MLLILHAQSHHGFNLGVPQKPYHLEVPGWDGDWGMGLQGHPWIHPQMILAADCALSGGAGLKRVLGVGPKEATYYPGSSLLSLLLGHHAVSKFLSTVPLCHVVSALEAASCALMLLKT